MQNLDILGTKVFFLLYILLKILKQGISSSVTFALTIIDLKIVTREFLGPADLPGAKTLGIYKSTEVL